MERPQGRPGNNRDQEAGPVGWFSLWILRQYSIISEKLNELAVTNSTGMAGFAAGKPAIP